MYIPTYVYIFDLSLNNENVFKKFIELPSYEYLKSYTVDSADKYNDYTNIRLQLMWAYCLFIQKKKIHLHTLSRATYRDCITG